MTQIKIKRTYEEAQPGDGVRVLVDKLWPRGIKKENLPYDFWEKDIAPSTALREWYHEDTEGRWNEFKKKYTKELENSPAVKEFTEKIKGAKTVTLLYAAKSPTENHALVLQEFLEKALK